MKLIEDYDEKKKEEDLKYQKRILIVNIITMFITSYVVDFLNLHGNKIFSVDSFYKMVIITSVFISIWFVVNKISLKLRKM